jgi:hypothetical protein
MRESNAASFRVIRENVGLSGQKLVNQQLQLLKSTRPGKFAKLLRRSRRAQRRRRTPHAPHSHILKNIKIHRRFKATTTSAKALPLG